MELNQLTFKNGKYYLLLFVIGLTVYWPLTFQLFSLKNDAVSYFLPFRYHVSNAIQHGYFPFWSPYLYTGLPIHADIQSGVWNPVVMFLSLFTTYDMTLLEAEVLLYLVISGVGFFKLCRNYDFTAQISLTLAVSYMCCGFMIDSVSFIPWITSAAWLPFMLLYFIRIMKRPETSNAVKLSLFSSLVFLSGYTSFFIIASYLILSLSVLFIIWYIKNKKVFPGGFFKSMSIATILALVICSPALISYIDFLPYYSRGSGTSLSGTLTNPFVFTNLISLVFPPATYKLTSANDMVSRNAYIGLLPLLFIIYSFRFRFTRMQQLLVVLTIFSLLISLGSATPIRAFLYHLLPFMNSFRHPGSVRIFTTIGLLLLAGYGWNSFLKNNSGIFIKRLTYITSFLFLLVTGYFFFYSNTAQDVKEIAGTSFNRNNIREFIGKSSFGLWLVLSGIVQVFFLLLFYFNKRKFPLYVLSVTNMIFMTLLCMPFTTVSSYKPSEINSFIKSFPEGFPTNTLQLPVSNKMNDISTLTKFGYSEFYTKQISLQDHLLTPTINSDYHQMLRDSGTRNSIQQHAFVYSSTGDSILLTAFTPNSFTFLSKNADSATLMITQQYNHNWKAWVGTTALHIEKHAIAFMKIDLPPGNATIILEYKPRTVIILSYISLLFFIGCAGFLVYFRAKKP